MSALARDLDTMIGRRKALGTLALGFGGSLMAACGGRAVAAAEAAACIATPTEIKGPFPADGSNGRPRRINVLDLDGVIRRDIRPSFAGLGGVAEGVPVDLELRLLSLGGCAPMTGHAIYLWQNDAAGEYSLYTKPQANYLRGLQATDGQGVARFTSIVPGCYGGRYPHCHFEVYRSMDAARRGEEPLLVSQLAFPGKQCRAVYQGDDRYGDSLIQLDRLPLERDFVFGDAAADTLAAQTIALSGDARRGFSGTATISISG